jgi:Mor family transcriptional regulator
VTPESFTSVAEDPLGEAIRRAVRQPVVIESLCSTLEQQLRQQFQQDLGGAPVYVSKRGGKLAMQARNDRIRQAFSGDNYAELAREHGLHPRQVRRIVQEPRKK